MSLYKADFLASIETMCSKATAMDLLTPIRSLEFDV